MRKMSSYAKSGTEVIRMQPSPFVCSQVDIFVYVSVCLLAMVLQSVDQWWRRFLFCLQPAGLAVAAKFSLLLLRSISLLLAFPAKYCFLCRVRHEPSDLPNVYCRKYKPDYSSLSISRFLLSSKLLLLSDQHFHYFRSHIKIILILFVCKAAWGYKPIKRTEENLFYAPFNTEQEKITMKSAKFSQMCETDRPSPGSI